MRRRCAKCYCDKTEELFHIGSTETCKHCKEVLHSNFVAVNVDIYLAVIRDFLLKQCKGNARSGLKKYFHLFPIEVFTKLWTYEGVPTRNTSHNKGKQVRRILTSQDQVARLCAFDNIPCRRGRAFESTVITEHEDICMIAAPLELTRYTNSEGQQYLCIKFNTVYISDTGRVKFAIDYPRTSAAWGLKDNAVVVPCGDIDLRVTFITLNTVERASCHIEFKPDVKQAIKEAAAIARGGVREKA
jgi:hypothetical protein